MNLSLPSPQHWGYEKLGWKECNILFLIDLYSWHRSPSSDTRSPRLQGLFLPLSSLQSLIYYRTNNRYKKKRFDIKKKIYQKLFIFLILIFYLKTIRYLFKFHDFINFNLQINHFQLVYIIYLKMITYTNLFYN